MKHRIKEFRDVHGMSQKEFAEVCYVADGPSRLPPYLDTDESGRVIKWKQTRRPYIGSRKL